MLKQTKLKNWAQPVNALLFLVLVMLILGVFFRFVNLDKKPYWHDETFTSLRISGYTKAELIQQASDQGVFPIKDLLKYQYPNPEKNVINVVNSLAAEDTHPPFHVLITRFWMQWFGNSPAVARNLSAVISLLALPCIYYLCLELFNSPLTGWMAICLLAVSPFHVLYAQKAREYSLWTNITIPILILEIYSTYFCKKSLQKAWLFILTLVGVTAIALVLPDLLWGGRRSTVSRYFITCYLGIHLSVAYLIATQITPTSFPQRKIWQIIIAMLISCGILSCAISPQSVVW